ncbi:MAG: type I DNA topoisomerase [Nitrospirae bacterium]|nr:type I DNA topoisomerase [Nitrospirota bacterium]MBF0533449.1 type I DNA topoisomerase [Nitrospirota bacterium]MBF0616027.1 type I DNA topoisomerase [Nitrospirota bacterium]
MALKLLIVESPAKAKTIEKILGKDFTVKASVGHILDLPKKVLGVDRENGYEPEYVTIPGKEKITLELREAAQKAEEVYLAPDPDREGEIIAWHISTIISKNKGRQPKMFRVTFNEITERAVKEAMTRPSNIDMNKVNAQQARRVLDRLVGYGLSPMLWKKISFGLSAGRVQSVAVRLIVDREREIEAFKKEEYWSLTASFLADIEPSFPAKLHKYEGKTVIEKSSKGNKFLITKEEQATKIRESLLVETYTLKSVDKKEKKRMPAPPFITSTLQQEAIKKLRFTAKKTMSIAQKLYEGVGLGSEGSVGLISYMRTDSVRSAPEAVKWAREYIEKTFGKEYIPTKPHTFKTKRSAQDAHEAIRPTYVKYPPEAVKKYLKPEEYALYELIWKRFMASQMAQAELLQTSFDIFDSAEKALFRASGTIIKFKGFLALYSEALESDDSGETSVLPALSGGEKLKLLELKPEQHFTQPPPRYTEASLVKTLEEKGVGRPSTYAAILSTIGERQYVNKEEGKFKPTELGKIVNDLLVKRFPELIDITFTAKMEDDLDKVEEGSIAWNALIGDFYPPFKKELDEATEAKDRVKPEDIPTDTVCEKCGKVMVKKWSKNGWFLSCSGYPKCKNAKPLDDEQNGTSGAPVEQTDEICDKCSSPMIIKTGKFGRFMACSAYPDCKNIKPIPTGLKCPEDGGDLIERKSTKGKFRGRIFYSCSNYPKCKFISNYKPVNESCPHCNAKTMYEKKNKDGDTIIFCQNKDCKHKSVVAD